MVYEKHIYELEGYFNKPEDIEFNESPECSEYLVNLVDRTKWSASDIVGIYFVKRESWGDIFQWLYFTQRGLEEQKQPRLKKLYRYLPIEPNSGYNNSLEAHINTFGTPNGETGYSMDAEFVDLKGYDGQKRVLAFHVKDVSQICADKLAKLNTCQNEF